MEVNSKIASIPVMSCGFTVGDKVIFIHTTGRLGVGTVICTECFGGSGWIVDVSIKDAIGRYPADGISRHYEHELQSVTAIQQALAEAGI